MIWFFRSFVVPLHPMASHKNGWWLVIRCSLNAIHSRTKEIEYDLLSVALKILNLLNCLYTKKSCNFFQSYGKRLTLKSNFRELTQNGRK